MGVMDICPFFCFSAFVYKCALRVQCFMAIVKKGFVTYDENFISLMHSTSKKKKKKKNKNLFFIFFFFSSLGAWGSVEPTGRNRNLPLCIPACKKKKFVPPCVLLYFAAGSFAKLKTYVVCFFTLYHFNCTRLSYKIKNIYIFNHLY